MNNYIINQKTLCFTQDVDDTKKTLIIERNDSTKIEMDCFKYLKRSCNYYGHSYKSLRQYVIDIFNFYIKTPIIVSEHDRLIFFPTTSPESDECIWISYNNVDRYVKENNYTKIYFKGGKILNISASFITIDSQITKCIKIERHLNSKNRIR